MSNVLIGILGVILFIGLAVAGAFFLGDAWNDSRRAAKAAATIEALAQIAAAYSLRNLPTGITWSGPFDVAANLVGTEYLKAVPEVDIMESDYLFVNTTDISSSTLTHEAILVSIGAREFECRDIERRSRIDPYVAITLDTIGDVTDITPAIVRRFGCFHAVDGLAAIAVPADSYVVYMRL